MTDDRGNPVSTESAEALAHAERALWRMMSFYDVPTADLDAAESADPGWVLPRLMRAGFLLSLTEPGLVAEAVGLLATVTAQDARLTERERAHADALLAIADGRWHAAVQVWDRLLVDHPRDALALQWAHLWDFYRGDLAGLRGRPARCLAAWDENDPLYACVLALHAFGLEENNLQAAAEEAGRRALAIDARVPWAIHAVAHVMEMQGRFEEGSAWLRQHQPLWAEGNGFAGHLWWHSALFRLEGLDHSGALRLVDSHLSGDSLQITLQRVDASAMLWRLHLLGSDVTERCRALRHSWLLDPSNVGYYAFNDVHALLPMLVIQDTAAAEAWIARCAERAMAAGDARRSNHAMAREVGLPLMRGLLLLSRGQHSAAADTLYPIRALAQRFGGSHAQRDLIDQSLLAACQPTPGDAGSRRLGQALLRERVLAKPATPLTQHWAALIGGAAPG